MELVKKLILVDSAALPFLLTFFKLLLILQFHVVLKMKFPTSDSTVRYPRFDADI